MKKYVKNSFGDKGGKVVLAVFFVLLISLSFCGALYVFYGDQWLGKNQADVVQASYGNYGTCVFTIETKSMKLNTDEQKNIKINSDNSNAEKIITWTSSDSQIAHVDPTGTVTGLKKGKATITATAGYYSSTCEVNVSESDSSVEKSFSTAYVANQDILNKNIQENSDQNLYYVDVNRTKNCVTVYTYDENGEYTVPVRAMICSCGAGDDTPTGEFSVFVKHRWHTLFGDVYGQYTTAFNDDILFHSVPYEQYEEPDSVEVEDYNSLGQSISMGCVRLAVADAKWIYENCDEGTTVRVYEDEESGPLGTPPSMKINNGKSAYWDPTDDDENNPYYSKVPTFSGIDDVTVNSGDYFDPMKNVSAKDTSDSDMDVSKIKVDGKVNSDKSGEYLIKYSVTDDMGRTTTQYRKVTVE